MLRLFDIKTLKTQKPFVLVDTNDYTLPNLSGKFWCARTKINGRDVKGYIRQVWLKRDVEKRETDREYFRIEAMKLARRGGGSRRTVYVDPRSLMCVRKAYPIEYRSAREIAESIVAAADCANGLVDEIHIIGHGVGQGLPGSGDLQHSLGLYLDRVVAKKKKSSARMSTTQFARMTRGALAKGVRVTIRACHSGDRFKGQMGVAEELADRLRKVGGHSRATVKGLPGAGDVERTNFITYPRRP